MDISSLLPIGSVVTLEGGKKRLMIFGVKQTDDAAPDVEYDYIGVIYPEGNVGKELQYLFNHENIAEVAFRGFEDEERTTFIAKLDELYQKQAVG
ncbi:MAG: DUF4176 domain-containing protein [Gracilibacteraceae bacterium]|jgi:hypothetical protein|nr:DUF4176 domain-containing protein [Gracilibacteraceae bacterium]